MDRLKGYINRESLNKTIPMVIFFAVLVIHNQAFCNNPGDAEMDKIAAAANSFFFAAWFKKILLCVAGAIGGYQSYHAGSPKPLMAWAGIGFIYNYIPKIADFISSLGT